MFESEQSADTEQCPPHALALGLDHSDFFLPFVPRPLILLGQEKDIFDARGLEQSHGHLRQLYRLIGESEKIALFIGADAHGFSRGIIIYLRPDRDLLPNLSFRATSTSAQCKVTLAS